MTANDPENGSGSTHVGSPQIPATDEAGDNLGLFSEATAVARKSYPGAILFFADGVMDNTVGPGKVRMGVCKFHFYVKSAHDAIIFVIVAYAPRHFQLETAPISDSYGKALTPLEPKLGFGDALSVAQSPPRESMGAVVGVEVYRPLYPGVTEPYYVFRGAKDEVVGIGADTGNLIDDAGLLQNVAKISRRIWTNELPTSTR